MLLLSSLDCEVGIVIFSYSHTRFLEFDIKLGTPGEVLPRYNIRVLVDYSMCFNLYQQAFLTSSPGIQLLN